MEEVEVVVAHQERATLRVGDVFLKVDATPGRLESEVRAMQLAPVPTPQVLWMKPPALALAALPGTPVARLGEPSTSSSAAWAAVGAAVRRLHDAPLPPWAGATTEDRAARLDKEAERLLADEMLPGDLVARGREAALAALSPRPPAFVHGDLQVAHVFLEGTHVTGVIDWSEAGQGDPMYDLAVLTLGHREHLDEVLAGYGDGADVDAIRGWWALRSLTSIRWLAAHGYDPFAPGCEVDVLKGL